MAEWFKAAVLKTVVLQGTGGSNPSPSARKPVKPAFFIQPKVSFVLGANTP